MNLYRVVRVDPGDPTPRYPAGRADVRYGSRAMVAGIVRDAKSVNRQRERYAASHPEIPYMPLRVTIELAALSSLTDVTAEFLGEG